MIMFDWLSRKPGRFVKPDAFQANLATQLRMTPITLEQIRGLGVTPTKNLKLEFFFYTDTPQKAQALQQTFGLTGLRCDDGRIRLRQEAACCHRLDITYGNECGRRSHLDT